MTALGVIHLIIPPRNADDAVLDPTQSVTGIGQTEHLEPSKLAINGVNESADAFTTLKSVVEGLSIILDHCDV